MLQEMRSGPGRRFNTLPISRRIFAEKESVEARRRKAELEQGVVVPPGLNVRQ